MQELFREREFKICSLKRKYQFHNASNTDGQYFLFHMSVSPHSGNFVFGCFWQQSYQNILSIIAHLALQTENIVQKITQPK